MVAGQRYSVVNDYQVDILTLLNLASVNNLVLKQLNSLSTVFAVTIFKLGTKGITMCKKVLRLFFRDFIVHCQYFVALIF
jgi:hypothetical protein